MTSTARTTLRETDIGNACRLVDLHGDDLRYVGTWSAWLTWDGRRFAEDHSGGSLRCAIDTARALVAEASAELKAGVDAIAGDTSDERAKKRKLSADRFFKHAAKSQDQRRIQAMLSLARADERVAITHGKLDADPWLLNVENGTIDLRTGKLRAHRREDLITKIAAVTFDARATCPLWDAFLRRAMGDDAELVDYLGRVFGYALTGATSEHVLGFFFGGGANGKSTALGVLHALLGDYAAPAPRGLLFRSRGDRHPTELAALHGRRFVTCSEIEDGQAFDEALVKDLTGGDPIAARRMNEDFWTFAPTHKLFLAGNHKPTVRGNDEGIWRRMRLVPWTITIPEVERDKTLPDKLRAELPGILAWCVRGCLAWQRQGLGDPVAVKEATRTYRLESDVLGEFFESRLAFGDAEDRITRKALRAAYETWCRDAGHEPLGAKRFAARLRERGVGDASVRVGSTVHDGWGGVRLLRDDEREARELAKSEGSRDFVGTGSGLVLTRARVCGDQPDLAPYKSQHPTADDDAERAAIEGAS